MLRLPAITTAVIAISLLAYWGITHVAGERKLAPLGALQGSGGYRITLDFAPERYHQQRMQDAGRLVEVRDRTVYMKDVQPAALRSLAAEYWVHDIARWDGS
jgi:hypothetical protein